MLDKYSSAGADQKVLLEGGVQTYMFCFALVIIIYRGEMGVHTNILSSPSSARQRNAIQWCFAGVPMMASSDSVIFQGGGQ